MGIERIKLGPKSRAAADVERSEARKAEVAKVKAQAAEQRPSRSALSEAAGLIGCACGREHVPARDKTYTSEDGVMHRYGRPCYVAEAVDGAEHVAELAGRAPATLGTLPDGTVLVVQADAAAATVRPERAGREGEQPLPQEGRGDILLSLAEQLLERRRIGKRRYGRPLQAFNGRNPYRDLLEELLDATAYAEQVRVEHEAVVAALEVLARYVREGHERTEAVGSALGLAAALERINQAGGTGT
jgi:hypothetical protein